MKKNLVYLFFLILTMSLSSCLKYKELGNIKGLEIDVQGSSPLFSYQLTVKDLFFKTAGYDSTKLQVDPNNKIYFWAQNLPRVSAITSAKDSLHFNIPINRFLGKDSVSFQTSGLGSDVIVVLNPFTGAFKFQFPVKTGSLKLDDKTLSILRLDNLSGRLKLKITNSYVFPVKIEISFPDLSGVTNIIIDTLTRSGTKDTTIIIDNTTWTGSNNNAINYNITTTLLNPDNKSTLSPAEINNIAVANTKLVDTLWVDTYDAIFGDVGRNRYLFKDSIRQKISIVDPFILNPNSQSVFPNISLRIDYFNHTLGIAANAKIYDVFFKMKNGSLKRIEFLNTLTRNYTEDSFDFPSKITPMPSFNSIETPLTSFLLDTSNTNFKDLNLDITQIDSLLYNVNFYSPKDGLSQDLKSFIRQPSNPNFVNSAAGVFYIPYFLSSKIFIDTSKTSVINIPNDFYSNIQNIIQERNKGGELQEIELTMDVENNSIFIVTPQVYFMNNGQIIDSFSDGKQNISAARLSISGIVRIPTTSTITKKLTPAQWLQLNKCNRLTTRLLLETSKEIEFPAITNDMYFKFYFKVKNVGFKYLIQ